MNHLIEMIRLNNHLSKDVLHADETWTRVVQQDGRESKKKCYIWVYCTGAYDEPIVYYEFHESRASKWAKEFLKDYTGYLHSDYADKFNIPMFYD